MRIYDSLIFFLAFCLSLILSLPAISQSSEDGNINQHSKADSQTTPVINILPDIRMSRLTPDQKPKSDWIESQKELYRGVLKNNSYDILIVPFQVQGYATDRIARSLMARYLADRIESATSKRIPTITLVSRALGENARTFDDKEVYQLADDLKVQMLIRGYVGHNRDEKMILTIVVQTREGNNPIGSTTKITQIHSEGRAFSDENPPSEIFNQNLDDLITRLPLNLGGKPGTLVQNKAEDIPVPESIRTLAAGKTESPLINAYYLQMLGMLVPGDTTLKESFFERSLVALNHISPKSPDYPLLKARAFFYLHRRPAALAALQIPSTAADKAFLAVLNGDLPGLTKFTGEIKSPLQKLISEIELNDLRWSYKQLIEDQEYKTISPPSPDWAKVLINRLNEKNQWYVQSNLAISEKLIQAFPRPKMNAPNEQNVDLSYYDHYRQVLQKEGRKFGSPAGSSYAVEADYLDLLIALGESNLVKKVRLALFMQGLPDLALQTLKSYERIYLGNPEMTALKAEALWKTGEAKRGDIRGALEKESRELSYKAYYWAQRQTSDVYSFRLGSSPFPDTFYLYEEDYPTRPYWLTLEGGDRKSLKTDFGNAFTTLSEYEQKAHTRMFLSLIYTQTDFQTLIMVYKGFLNVKTYMESRGIKSKADWGKMAETVLEANRHRFIGHPGRAVFLAENKNKKAVSSKAEVKDKPQPATTDLKKAYEDEIAANPDAWDAYWKLGKAFVREGNFRAALAAFKRYPLFSGKQATDPIRMSLYAAKAAVEFYWTGGLDEAEVLFDLSSNANTGSAAEMGSAASLALLRRDYGSAALISRQLFNRYNSRYGFRDFLELSFAAGNSEEAWSLIKKADSRSLSPEIWTAIFVGSRIQGWSSKELTELLLLDDFRKNNLNESLPLLMSFLIDRPRPSDAETFMNRIRRANDPLPIPKAADAHISELVGFVSAYHSVKERKFEEAFDAFKKNHYFNNNYEYIECALPYMRLAAVKTGNEKDLEKAVKTFKGFSSSPQPEEFDFYEHLAEAVSVGLQGDEQGALRHLQLASYSIPATRSKPLYGWFELVDIGERLFRETGAPAYKEMVLKWSKIHQRIQPVFAWAYALEAKYTDSKADRLRALALTLYLDNNSEHISHFPRAEKEKALKWLERNNPFTKNPN